ncbi:spore germination protein [Bacillus firmus]|nr:spore germination protein [Cytobacillus firmus]MDD9314228.1 spore germination protein [Cytobacillus firmus]MEC1893568.1 spore germination protein [Cytobacillus firmus]MED1908420.1 spore germination protein [Cytobacillus firmus]MED1943249.1 spore germination protein [Cytobacillus firmus]MED4448412.1 spore germination protein [Cytobacillus firmus]
MFPLSADTSRPEFEVDCLLQGRIIVIVDGSPLVIIAPVNITFLIKQQKIHILTIYPLR